MKPLPQTYVGLYREASGEKPLQILRNPEWARLEYQRRPNQDFVKSLRISREFKTWETALPPNVLFLQSTTPLTIGDIRLLLNAEDQKSFAHKAKIVSMSFAWRSADGEDRFLHRLLLSCMKELGKDSNEEMVVPDIFESRATPLWTDRQIWVLFRTMLSSWKGREVVFIITSVERCPPHKRWFIDELKQFANENDRDFRIIISQKDHELEYLNDSIDVHNIDVDSIAGQPELGEDMLNALLSRRPKLKILRHEIWNRFKGCSTLSGYAGKRLVLRHLETASISFTRLSMRREMEQFSDLHVWKVAEVLLGNIPNEKRDRMLDILTWVTYAREPLSVISLSAALAIGETTASLETWNDNIAHDFAADLEQGGLLSLLDLENGYVRFVDDGLYQYFLKPNDGYWHIPSYESDWTLCKKCICFLSSEDIIKKFRDYSQESQASQPLGNCDGMWHEILPYANRSWPNHYRAAAKKNCADHSFVLEFLRNINAVRAWSETYWDLEEPVFKQRRGLTSLEPLHIAVRFGFVEITEMLLNEVNSTAQGDLRTDISCAAQNGHADILQMLLGKFNPDPAILHHVLQDASNIESEAVLQTLLQYEGIKPLPREAILTLPGVISENGWATGLACFLNVAKNHDEDILINSETATPLHHAANHGYENIVELLQTARTMKATPLVQNDGKQSYSPLHLAAMRGHAGVVRQIVDPTGNTKISPLLLGPKSRTALHLAAKNGFSHIAGILAQTNGSNNYPRSADARDDEGSTALHLACRGGFFESFLELIEGSDTRVEDDENSNILHAAAQGGNFAIVGKLLCSYQDVVDNLIDKKNKFGDLPLQVALKEKHEAAAVLLINGGIYAKGFQDYKWESRVSLLITNRNSNGKCALALAMENGLKHAIAAILRHKRIANEIEGSCWGQPELLAAAAEGYPHIVSEVLASQHVNTKDRHSGRNLVSERTENVLEALKLASRNGHLDVVKELLRHVRVLPTQLQPSLKAAATQNHIHVLEYLGHVVTPDARATLFSSMKDEFMMAATLGRVGMVSALLDRGMDVNYQDKYQNTALMLAAFHNQHDVVRLLLLRKADTELQDDSQSTAISDAAGKSSTACVELLIQARARVNVQDDYGQTPIAWAIWFCRPDVVSLLLRAGADVEIQDRFGKDALSKAAELGRKDILKIILALNPSKECLRRALIYAAKHLAIDVIQMLEQHGATVEPSIWPLHEAIREGNKETARYFLERGADKEQVVEGEMGTPLQQAIYFGQHEIVDLLLSAKVDVNQEGGPHHTALHVAAFRDMTWKASTVQKLLEAGAKADIEGGKW